MRNNTIIKFIIVFSVILTAFWGSTRVASTHQLLGPVGESKTNAPNDASNAYLPLVDNNACIPGTVESPFSIEIAALHQITTTVTSSGGQGMSEEPLYAWYDQAFPTLLDALKESGAGWTRIVIRWFDIEPTAPISGTPVYNSGWWKWYDDRLLQISQAGVKIIAIVNSAPAWANNNQICPAVTSDHLQEYGRFLTDLVTRYSQPPYNINHWEIFNEADNTTTGRAESHACFGNYSSNYAQVLSISYPIIKTIDPNATVLMSGLAYEAWTEPPYNGPFYRYFPDDVMLTGGASYFDALNFHYFPDYRLEWERWNPPAQPPTCGRPPEEGQGSAYYGGGIDVIAKKNYYTNRMSTCLSVNKPIWLTETSEHGVVTDTESLRNQADYVIKVYTRGLAAEIRNITWFALAAPIDTYSQCLLDLDFSPKPAFYAYKAMVSELTNFRYKQTLPITGGEAYVFQNSCLSEKTVAWGDNIPLIFSPATSLRVVDYLGNVSIVQDGGPGDGDGILNGAIQITLTSDPVFISVTDP